MNFKAPFGEYEGQQLGQDGGCCFKSFIPCSQLPPSLLGTSVTHTLSGSTDVRFQSEHSQNKRGSSQSEPSVRLDATCGSSAFTSCLLSCSTAGLPVTTVIVTTLTWFSLSRAWDNRRSGLRPERFDQGPKWSLGRKWCTVFGLNVISHIITEGRWDYGARMEETQNVVVVVDDGRRSFACLMVRRSNLQVGNTWLSFTTPAQLMQLGLHRPQLNR